MNAIRICARACALVAVIWLLNAGIALAQQATPATSEAIRVTLQDALARARKNSVQFQSAQTDAALARQDR